MAAGESQDWSWAASGCVRRLFFVFVSYRSTAALKIDWKLDSEGVEGAFGTWDIEVIAKQVSLREEDDRKFASANTEDGWRWKFASRRILGLVQFIIHCTSCHVTRVMN